LRERERERPGIGGKRRGAFILLSRFFEEHLFFFFPFSFFQNDQVNKEKSRSRNQNRREREETENRIEEEEEKSSTKRVCRKQFLEKENKG
jgi:hypothetical protein